MSARELYTLGTASQVPTRYRNHNGYFLRWDGWGLLFDPGEGTQRQMIRSGVSASKIHRVLITHFHGDHCLGFAGLVQRISLDEVPHPIGVIYPESGQVYLDRLRRASIFLDRTQLQLRPIRAPGVIDREPGTFTIETLPLDHGVPSWGYRLVEPDGLRMLPEKLAAAEVRGPLVGQLLRDGRVTAGGRTVHLHEVSEPRRGQVFAFVMDTRICDNAVALARGADLLVCESTYRSTETREAIERGHMTAAQAAEVAREAGARRLVLTHFSQRYPEVQPFLEEAAAVHPEVVAATDGDIIPVPARI